MSRRCLKTSDHDLDLQCQIGFETKHFMYFLVYETTLEPFEILALNLNWFLII